MSDPQLENSLTTYAEKQLSDNSFLLVDIRQIQYPKLIPYTLEAKYPQLVGKLEEDNLTNNFLTLLATEPFNPQEAVRIIGSSPNFFIDERFPKDSHEDFIRKVYEHHNIDYANIASQVDKALIETIDELAIPDEEKKIIRGKLAKSHIEFGFGNGSKAFAEDLHTYIDLSFPIYQAYCLSQLLNIPITEGLIKTMLVANIAHERGHIIDFSGEDSAPSIKAFSNFIEDTDAKFPIKIIESPERIKDMMFYERTAMFFEYQSIRKLGLSVEAAEDYARYCISITMRILDKVPPNKLTQFIHETKNIPENNHAAREVADVITQTLSGHAIAQSFPFSKEDIEKGITKAGESRKQWK